MEILYHTSINSVYNNLEWEDFVLRIVYENGYSNAEYIVYMFHNWGDLPI